jgi:phosphate transport system substrate-binding protein
VRHRKLFTALAATLVLGVAVPASAGATTLIGSGSVAAQPVLLALFQAYKSVDPSIQFIYTADGGNAGVKDVQRGKSQFAGQARPPLPTDAGTTYVKLYLDGLCVIANKGNGLRDFSLTDLANVYGGVSTNWSQIAGSGLSSTIAPFGRDANGGTYTFFTSAVLNGKTPASNVTALSSDGLIANAVSSNPNAIGYISHAYGATGTKTLTVNGTACNARYIKTLKYPLSRFIWLVLPSTNPDPNVQKFADWVRTSVEAGKVISRNGEVPVFNKTAKKTRKPKHGKRH